MKHQLQSYLSFLLRSTNAHGVHSPFVYQLLTACFYDRSSHKAYQLLKQHRNDLRKDSSAIEVTDFGAGSRVFTSHTRTVSAIAKHAGISVKRQQLLYRLVRYFNSTTILELGTSAGMSTAAMALGNPKATLQTVEGCSNTLAIAKKYFSAYKLTNIQTYAMTFEAFFEKQPLHTYDLVFIDGNHSKERTLQYFETLLPYLHNDSVVLFDDIYWSKEMTEAWQEIYQSKHVTVSIDTFQWGLVFFRKEQPKQHFCIRL